MSSEKEKTPRPTAEQVSEMQIQINSLILQNMQLTRMIWSLVRKAGGSVVMDPEEIPMLWRLEKQAHGERTILLKSSELPELEESQVAKIAAFLLAGEGDLLQARQKFEIAEYPRVYVQLRLTPYARLTEDGWQRADSNTDPQRN